MINFFDVPTNVPISELEHISVLNDDILFLVSQRCSSTESGYISKYLKYDTLYNSLSETFEMSDLQAHVEHFFETQFMKENFVSNHISIDVQNPWIPNGFKYDILTNDKTGKQEVGLYELSGFRLSAGMKSEFTKVAPDNSKQTISNMIPSIVETRKTVSDGTSFHLRGTVDSCGNLKNIYETPITSVIQTQLQRKTIQADRGNYISRIQTKGGDITLHSVESLFAQVGSVSYCDISRKTINDINLTPHNLKILKCRDDQFDAISSQHKLEPDSLYLTISEYQKPEFCTVTFYSEPGTPQLQYKTVQYRHAIGELPTVSYSNLTFGGWRTEDGTPVDEDFIVTSDITLYSHEVATITFESTNAENTMPSQIVELSVLTELNKNVFTYEGYDFQWWLSTDEGVFKNKTPIEQENGLYRYHLAQPSDSYLDQARISVSNNITLKPQWTRKIVTIQTQVNSESVSPVIRGTVSQSKPTYYDKNTTAYDYDEKVTISATAKSGYVFSGWTNASENETSSKIIITAKENKIYEANFLSAKVAVKFVRILNGQEKELSTVTKNRYQAYGSIPKTLGNVTGYKWDGIWTDQNGNQLLSTTVMNDNITYYATGYEGETKKFKHSASLQTYTVPENCTKIRYIVAGADGNYVDDESLLGNRITLDDCIQDDSGRYIYDKDDDDYDATLVTRASYLYGAGSLVAGTLNVVPGQKLYIYAGTKVSKPSENSISARYNASDIRLQSGTISGNSQLDSRLVVAAGGGNGYRFDLNITTGQNKGAKLSVYALGGGTDHYNDYTPLVVQESKYAVICEINKEKTNVTSVDNDKYQEFEYDSTRPVFIGYKEATKLTDLEWEPSDENDKLSNYVQIRPFDGTEILEKTYVPYQYSFESAFNSVGDQAWTYGDLVKSEDFEYGPVGAFYFEPDVPGNYGLEKFDDEKYSDYWNEEQDNIGYVYDGKLGLGGYRRKESHWNVNGLNGGGGVIGSGSGFFRNDSTYKIVSPTQKGISGYDWLKMLKADQDEDRVVESFSCLPKYYYPIDIESKDADDFDLIIEDIIKKYEWSYAPMPEYYQKEFGGHGFVILKPEVN